MNTIYLIIGFIIFYLLFGCKIIENYRKTPRRSDGRTKYSKQSSVPIRSSRNKLYSGYNRVHNIKHNRKHNKTHYKRYNRRYKKYGHFDRGYYNYPNYVYYPYFYDSVYHNLMFDPYYSHTNPVLNEHNCKTLYPCPCPCPKDDTSD